jgi:RNA polymerase sigma-70 factor (ECF subfamily)
MMEVSYRELIDRLSVRDSTAQTEFVERFKETIHRVAFRVNPSRAEDVAQDTFGAIFRNVERLRSLVDFDQCRRFVDQMAHNKAIDQCRISTRQKKPELSYARRKKTEDGDKPDELDGLDVEELYWALKKLTERERNLLDMKHLQDLSSYDIGQKLGLTEKTVNVALHRARLKLRKMLESPPDR